MTPQAQQIAIAETQGWKGPLSPEVRKVTEGFVTRDTQQWVLDPSGQLSSIHTIPDYLGDLNAIHQAALTLTPKERAEYCNVLIDVANAYVDFQTVEATAAERAETFLRVKGLWTGGAIRG